MLWDEVEVIRKQLDQALKTWRSNGLAWCEAEKEYRKLKSQEILRLRAEGLPVTLIPDIVKGLDEVAELDFKRNAAEVIYKANGEAINVKKAEFKAMESELEREYVSENNTGDS